MLHVSFVVPLVTMGWCALVGGALMFLATISQLRHSAERNMLRHAEGYWIDFILRTLFWTIIGAVVLALVAFVFYQIFTAG